MKKLRILALLLVLCCLPHAAMAAITAAQGRELALGYLQEQYQISPDQVHFHQLGKSEDQKVWSFSFILKEQQEDTDGLYLVDLYIDGSLKELTPPRFMYPEERMNRDFQEQTWPLTTKNMLHLKEKWAPYLDEIMQYAIENDTSGVQTLENSLGYAMVRALRQGFALLVPDALSLDQAQALAEAAILATPTWTAQRLAHYLPYLQAHYVSQELGRPIWHFIYHRELSTSPRFINSSYETYERAYLNLLKQEFGSNANTPLYVSLRLDATSGELAGEVDTFYSPPAVNYVLANVK